MSDRKAEIEVELARLRNESRLLVEEVRLLARQHERLTAEYRVLDEELEAIKKAENST